MYWKQFWAMISDRTAWLTNLLIYLIKLIFFMLYCLTHFKVVKSKIIIVNQVYTQKSLNKSSLCTFYYQSFIRWVTSFLLQERTSSSWIQSFKELLNKSRGNPKQIQSTLYTNLRRFILSMITDVVTRSRSFLINN